MSRPAVLWERCEGSELVRVSFPGDPPGWRKHPVELEDIYGAAHELGLPVRQVGEGEDLDPQWCRKCGRQSHGAPPLEGKSYPADVGG